MGFTTGFIGGITLTYSVIYLSVYVHRQNRTHQSLLLKQQAKLLTSRIDPPVQEYEPPAYRVEQAGITEQLKDRWNREVATLVNKAQTTDWETVRIDTEKKISNVWNKLRSTEKAQELEQRFKENVVGTENTAGTLTQSATEAVQGKRLLEEK